MTHWRRIGILGIALWGALWAAPATLAATAGYTIDDLKLTTAGDLVDVCTVAPSHEHYDTALGFCYGFFEGAIRYHQAIADAAQHKKLVCAPESTTRQQAIDVFVSYLQENPQYANEATIDAIFRALIARWPCPDAP